MSLHKLYSGIAVSGVGSTDFSVSPYSCVAENNLTKQDLQQLSATFLYVRVRDYSDVPDEFTDAHSQEGMPGPSFYACFD